jgi:branched-chain amino acid transport system permease protein
MTVILAGLAIGAVYVLTALGYNLVFVSAGLFNFAQAQFIMIGTFISYWAAAQLHMPVLLGIPLGLAAGFGLGALEEIFAINPLRRVGSQSELIVTLGVGVVLDGLAYVIWGSQPLAVPFAGPAKALNVLGGKILPVELTLVAVAVAASVALAGWTRFSLIGTASVAVSEDTTAAAARGIDPRKFSLLSVAAAAALAAAIGPLIGPKTYAVYNLGDQLAIIAFVCLAIGGFGSYLGALVGGMAVGLAESVGARYISPPYGDLLVFAMLLAVLMIRPSGLFRSAAVRKV